MRKIFLASKQLVSPNEQGADFVELFFDLVFVYAITRITALTAHNLDGVHLVQSILIFWLIWWGWTQFTWALNAANTRIAEVRMMVLIATGVAFLMASSVSDAFGSGVMFFALPYVAIRTIGIGLYIRVTSNLKEKGNPVIAFAVPSVFGLIAVLLGAFADPSIRGWWWLTAIAFDMLAGYLGGRAEGWDLKAKHFAERHGLIVIIALGESLIVAANAVSTQEGSQNLLIESVLALLIMCLLWWSYFSWIHEHLEEHLASKSGSNQAILARDAYSFMHFPLICGIIGIAVSFEKIMGHPNDVLSIPVAAALGGGFLFFVGFTALSVWRLSKLFLLPRLIIVIIAIIGVVFSIGHPSYWALAIIVVSLILLIFIEWRKCRHS